MRPHPLPSPLSTNERQILDLIRRRETIPRARIANITGLTSASVTRITQGMEERGLIEETEATRNGRGQPAKPLRLRAAGGCAIGLNFSHSTVDAVLLDLAGNIRAVIDAPLANTALETIVETSQSLCHDLLARHPGIGAAMVGVGVSVPGYRSERPDRFALHPTFSSLLTRNLTEEFRGSLAQPVMVERDAISAAVGESLIGHGRNRTSFGFVHLGHGIGGALVQNGAPIYGAHGNAGGIGDLFPRDRPRPSGSDLIEALRDAGLDVSDFRDLTAFVPGICDPLDRWIERAARELRDGLALFARIFDPHAIILGGRLPLPICEQLVQRITDLPQPATYTDNLPQPEIKVSTHGPLSGAIGAACLPLYSQFFLL
ncbi:ROK family transcriptional regulator [Sphingomonas sp. AP4-R1]|uniref:ROK family transcriptional regulator n=1 Tax=Sphingomonas sp. AP4-R1 TaxID=2735134 RepID=UPI001493C130|nr:ROK family transcriptional regulator [Sphingomonas sp. AP4-R1]QJU59959.1 ROK family transcriptional regulator [Sphingomonas sp. AP4-R1]